MPSYRCGHHLLLLLVVVFAVAVAAAARDLDPQTCVDNFDIHRDKIIRTEDSREMGAKYLNEIDLGTRDECLRLCCETDTCDVFVFEEKNPGSCYLFHCGPPEDFKCKFTRHTNFSSAVLAVNRHLAELEDQIKLTKHEQDLASLRKQYQEVITTPKTTTSTAVVGLQMHETPAPIQGIGNVGINKSARRCSRFQFECHSSDECIAIYNACDGIPQCADGSDEAPELGCPATTTLPPPPPQPPNLPPREIMPRLPQMQPLPMYNPSMVDGAPMNKEIPPPHPPPFMSPISSQDGSAWPRRLDQLPQPSIQHDKQYGGSHIFKHKGVLQVAESDGAIPNQYDYKQMPYEPISDNTWQHRSWQQSQQEPSSINDGPSMYHMDMEPQNSWKQQQPIQNIPMQHRIQNIPDQGLPQRNQPERLNPQIMPNMFKDRDKMWAVPQTSPQENKQTYQQSNSGNSNEESYETIKYNVNPTPFPAKTNDAEDNAEETAETKKIEDGDEAKESKNGKKHPVNKTKKKHLKNEESESVKGDSKVAKEEPVHDKMVMGMQIIEDVHDGAAERPPGAILLLTLGVCMTSIMVVLLGCRLKMARRRMRRTGKSPFAHDADYLVNGMYL